MRKLFPPCRLRALVLLLGLTTLSATLVSPARAARIESDTSKVYHLRKKHGPWMIKVASFSGETPEQRQNSIEAANQLVHLLRAKNIPAYIYQQDEQIADIDTYDTQRRLQRRHFTAQHGEIAVLAGNYDSVENKVAQATLKYIKKLTPKVEVQHHGDQVEYPLALKKAFLTPNPLLPAEELRRRSRDPLIAHLNSGVRNSLLENKGKYTLIVASFYGNSAIKPTTFASFERDLADKKSISLDNAGESAVEMATVMRNQYKMEAFVYHERYRSIVTVGSFSTPNDPAITKLISELKAKEKLDPGTRQKVLAGEAIHLMGRDGKTPIRSWALDPAPEVMEVPKW